MRDKANAPLPPCSLPIASPPTAQQNSRSITTNNSKMKTTLPYARTLLLLLLGGLFPLENRRCYRLLLRRFDASLQSLARILSSLSYSASH